MLHTSALEQRSVWWVLVFALGCAASSLYGWLVLGRSASLREYGRWLLCAAGGYAGHPNGERWSSQSNHFLTTNAISGAVKQR